MTIRELIVSLGFKVDRASESSAENSIKGLKQMATSLLGKIAVVFSITKIASFAKDCVEVASNVEEMENKFNVVFGEMSDEVDKWAENFADSIGRNKNAIKTYLADQQNLLVGFGMTREEGAKLSEEMTSLALDIASFANQDEDVAVNAMSKAVMGESEAAKTLGAVLNDATRAEAMQTLGIKGTYESLSQLEKMQVNYQAILTQSKDSVGDCVRSMGSYASSTRQLKAAQEEFKEFVGSQLLPVMSVFVQWTAKGVKAATKFAKAILLDADGNNRILLSFERVHAIVKRLQPAMERFTSSMKLGINKATDTVKTIVDRLGGMGNVLKLLAIIAGAFMLAMNWKKITDGAKSFLTLLQGIGKMFSLAKLKILAVVAVIVILALLIEDFINFLMGNDSVIGTVFDKLGIGADNARQAVFNAFKSIKSFLVKTWQDIKGAIDKHGSSIRKSISGIFGGAVTIVKAIFKTLIETASVAFAGLGNIFKGIDISTPINFIVSTIDVLLKALGKAGELISEHSGLVEVLVKAYAGFKIGSAIVQLAKLAAGFTVATAAKIKDAAETVYINALYAKDFVMGLKSTVIGLINQAKAFAASTAAKVADKAETIALYALYAKDFAVGIAKTTAALVKQAAQFAINTAAKAADAVAQGAMTAATVAWNVAAGIATTVTTALGAAIAFLTSPIGLVLIAIAALIAIGVLLYKNWDTVKEKALQLKDWIVNIFSNIKDKCSQLIQQFAEKFPAAFSFISSVFGSFKKTVTSVFDGVKAVFQGIIQFFSGVFTGDWSKALDGLKNIFSGTFKSLLSIAMAPLNNLKGVVVGAFNAIDTATGGKLTSIKSKVQEAFSNIKETAGTIMAAAKDTISEKLDNIKSAYEEHGGGIKGVAAAAIEGVKSYYTAGYSFLNNLTNGKLEEIRQKFAEKMSSIKTTIVDGFQSAIDFIKGLPSQAIQWGVDFINGLKDGILSGVQGVVDAVKGVGEKIKSYLHFSVPDEGPLTDYESWMPDFMNGLAQGIGSSEDVVIGKIRNLANDITMLMQSATASAATAASSQINNSTSSMTQNVNINNSYSGGSTETQRNVSKAMKKSAVDATTQMARGLAYARG